MAAILDRCVPSRRLQKKRQRVLQGGLHARFGDTHITAPTEGSWNQIDSDMDKDHLPGAVASNCYSPDLFDEKTTSEPRASVEEHMEHGISRHGSEKNNFTITIPLPWPARKHHKRTSSTANGTSISAAKRDHHEELSPGSYMSSSESTPYTMVSSPDLNNNSSGSSPNTTLQSQATSPVVIYKPFSEEYKQQLPNMTKGLHRVDSTPHLPPDRTQSVSPTNVTYTPASGDFAKEMAELGMGLSPALPQRETFARSPDLSNSTPIRLLQDSSPTPLDHSLELSLAYGGLPPDPRPTPVNHSPDPTQALIGLPVRPRGGTPRCASRGPAIDRIGSRRSASRGPVSDRARHTRSSSHGPAPDTRSNTRSASRGPASDRAGHTRSSSHVPAVDTLGTTRSASRGPPSDRIGTRRSSSRDPTSERLPTTRSASRGPLSERPINTSHCRSSSRGPTSTRIPSRESISSSSSIDSGITSSFSPTCNHTVSASTTTSTSTQTTPEVVVAATFQPHHNDSVGSATGYYSASAHDTRRIASDVEDSEHERRGVKALDRDRKTVQGPQQGPQEMVPGADALW